MTERYDATKAALGNPVNTTAEAVQLAALQQIALNLAVIADLLEAKQGG